MPSASDIGVWIPVVIRGRRDWEAMQRPAPMDAGAWEVFVRGHGITLGIVEWSGRLTESELTAAVIGAVGMASLFMESVDPEKFAALQADYIVAMGERT